MSMFDPKLKVTNLKRTIPKKGKKLSQKELLELETLRRKFFCSTPNFGPHLIRGYLDSKKGQDLEKEIFTTISQS